MTKLNTNSSYGSYGGMFIQAILDPDFIELKARYDEVKNDFGMNTRAG